MTETVGTGGVVSIHTIWNAKFIRDRITNELTGNQFDVWKSGIGYQAILDASIRVFRRREGVWRSCLERRCSVERRKVLNIRS